MHLGPWVGARATQDVFDELVEVLARVAQADDTALHAALLSCLTTLVEHQGSAALLRPAEPAVGAPAMFAGASSSGILLTAVVQVIAELAVRYFPAVGAALGVKGTTSAGAMEGPDANGSRGRILKRIALGWAGRQARWRACPRATWAR